MKPEEQQALQTWLALEHEAVWLYGQIGARVRDLAGDARASYDAHRTERDHLLAALHDAGATPAGPQLTYGDTLVSSAKQARAAAADLEDRICAACVTVVGVAGGAGRTRAVAGLRAAALSAVDWHADPQPFPGLRGSR
jgi:hypothetical protein